MGRLLQLIPNCSDPSDDFFILLRNKELDRCMLMKWMLCRIDELPHITPQRRNPVRIVSIKPVWELYEVFSIPLRPDGLDADLAGALAQIRSISRPTRLNASSTKSSCESVCVAM